MPSDLLAIATDELYGIEPTQFLARRQELSVAARRAGDTVAAKAIAALRRPVQSAYLLNRFARDRPELATELIELGAHLREAQRTFDGAQLQALSRQRRQLIDQTVRQVFASAGVTMPTAAARDDVAATLGAALADPAVGDQFATGVLVKPVHQSGFGPEGPHLASVPTQPARAAGSRKSPAAKQIAAKSPTEPTGPNGHARNLQRRQAAIAKAESAVAAAVRASTAAEAAQQEVEQTVDRLTEQLADARRRRDDARLDARRSAARLRTAQLALDQARK